MTAAAAEPSSERRFNWLLLVVALIASAWLVRRASQHTLRVPRAPADVDLVSVVPPGPELLVTADVAAVSPTVALELLNAGGSALLGLRQLCGFEPLLGLRRLVFAMPFRGADAKNAADFALIAATSLDAEPVLRCAEAVIRKRGGTPVRSHLGRFTSVRDQQKPIGEVAIRGDGLFVLSGGQYFRDVIDAANGAPLGDETSKLRSRVHAAIRRRLAPSQLAVTALSGAGLPLPGVQALGLGLELQSDVRLRGVVACPSVTGCGDARQMLERMKADVSNDPALAGLASLTIVQRDAELELAGRLPKEQLAVLLTQLFSP
jgi:hypothetical protein